MQEEKYTEESMQKALRWFISNPKYRIENLYVFNWESDLLFLTQAGYWYEIEIKISRSDFFCDAKKKVGKYSKAEFLSNPDKFAPNYFYYAVPKGLITLDEIPSHAGLIEIDNMSWDIKVKAPKLRDKIEVPLKLLVDKFYYNWRNEISNHRGTKREIERIKKRYTRVDETVKNEVSRTVNDERYNAVGAFKSVCPHFSTEYWRCEKEGRESSRCGWCNEIKEFEKKIYNENKNNEKI